MRSFISVAVLIHAACYSAMSGLLLEYRRYYHVMLSPVFFLYLDICWSNGLNSKRGKEERYCTLLERNLLS